MRLSGRVTIVTGARAELAGALRHAMSREGATVVIAPADADPSTVFAAAMAEQGRVDCAVVTATESAIAWCEAGATAVGASGGGAIITVVTTRALAGDIDALSDAALGGAIVASVRSIATAFGKQGVRANAIAIAPDDIDPGIVARSTLLPRLGRPDDVANLAVFLASDDAEFVTGQVIRCDGGLLAHLPHFATLVASGKTTTSR